MLVLKKNNIFTAYNEQKIIEAVNKSAQRVLYDLKYEDYVKICQEVYQGVSENCEYLEELDDEYISVEDIHAIVEETLLNLYPKIGQSYQQYRNYKLDFVKMLDEIYSKSQSIRYIGDISNANTDSAMISTQRSLIYGQLNKNLYQKFFLNKEENQACKDGYIYIHDMKDRLDGVNCMLFDMENVLKNGFEMGNIWYNEPNSLDTVFDVMSDVALSASSQQYGGFTISRVDSILAPYAEKSYQKYLDEYLNIIEEIDYDIYKNIKSETNLPEEYALKKVRRDMEQGFQGWEYKFNTVGSSRGDYPFISISFGIDTSRFGLMASEVALEIRKNGQGKKGFKKPVLFPKLTFLYDENLHGEEKEYEWLFEKGIDCSSKTMYPDWLSLTGEGYIPSIYKKYGQVISLMG